MHLNLRAVAITTVICLALPVGFAHAASTSKSGQGTMVIVFKDGHKQSFNLSEIERVEFPVSSAAASAPAPAGSPSRAHFLGKWEVGDGSGNNFFITLYDDGAARRSLGDERGRWEYVNGEARVTWNDGAQDAIRKVGSVYQKFAYGSGKSFTETPDNVTNARNTTPHPI